MPFGEVDGVMQHMQLGKWLRMRHNGSVVSHDARDVRSATAMRSVWLS